MAKYSAADVAACIIEYANKLKNPVSNLQLQKMLFFCQCAYLQRFREPLFDDEIVAWQYGPVVKQVYRMYSHRGASPIIKAERPLHSAVCNTHASIRELEDDALAIVHATVDRWINQPAWALVNQSHRKGGAWDRTFNEHGQGSGYGNAIPMNLMMSEAA